MNFGLLLCKIRFRAAPLSWLLGMEEEHQISLLTGEMPARRGQARVLTPPGGALGLGRSTWKLCPQQPESYLPLKGRC